MSATDATQAATTPGDLRPPDPRSREPRSRDIARPLVHLVACGSVDDGKSTLIGRLLAETGSVPEDQLDHARTVRRGGSAIPAGEIDYSLVTDGLEAEREQGITIDVAYRQLQLPSGRRVVIADAPGHEQYTRNMAVAASNADLALLVIDAERGLRPQTHRHLTVCALMGVGSVIVAVNKMDAVGHAQRVFDDLATRITADARRLGVSEIWCVPVSALRGDNVTEPSTSMPYYSGPTVLEVLAGWDPPHPEQRPLRLAVQYVTRSPGFRGYAGTVLAGSVSPGDEVATATGVNARVERVTTFDGDLERAEAGRAVTLVLDREVDVARGDLLAGAQDPPSPATAFSAELVWVGEQPLMHGRSYLLVSGPKVVPATVTALRARLEVTTGSEVAARRLEMNDIGRVEITTDTPLPLDPYGLCRDTGGFLLVDRVSCDTVAAGLVRHLLRRSDNVVPHAYVVDREARANLKSQQPRVLWLTGLPGSGKSTLADALERRLYAMGLHTYVLDGDNMRKGINRDLGFTPEDRAENVRRVAETAHLLLDAGIVVIVALVSPFRSDRRRAREMFEQGEFVEAFLDTPLEVCVRRDPKGLYSKAGGGALPNMTGVGQEYEPPESPEVLIEGSVPFEEAVELLVSALVPEHLPDR